MPETLDTRERGSLPIPSARFPGFLLWLQRRNDRPDAIGAFARNVARIERVRRGDFGSVVALLCFAHAMPGRFGEAMQRALDLCLAE
jgi:hypothetical protein